MKKFTLSICFISLFIFVNAQTPPFLVNSRCFGGSGNETGEITFLGPTLTRTPDNFILITGASNSTDGDIPNGQNKGGADIVVIKTDTFGNVIWTKNYGGSIGDGGCKTYVLPDSNYLILGSSLSLDGDISLNKGTQDVIILKVNRNNGSVIWSKNYGGSLDEQPHCAVVDSNSVTILCHTRSYDGDVTNKPAVMNNHDIWILKIDFNGTLIWQKVINGSATDYPFSIIKSNGNYFIMGSTLSTDGNYTDNHGMTDTWIAKVDNSGNIVWKRCVGGSNDDKPATLIQLNNGNFLALINTFSKDADANGAPTSTNKVKMFYVFKDNGSVVGIYFSKTSDVYADGVDIVQREDSSFLIAQHNSSDSVRISFMDTNFIISSRVHYGASGVTAAPASGLLLMPGNNCYTIRQTQATTGDVVGNHGGYDLWLLKIRLPAVKIYPKPPSQPYNLVCNIVNTSIKITWLDDGTTNRSYWIYRSMNDTLNYIRIDSVIPTLKQYTDATVLNGKRYYYKVAGVNNQGKLYSNNCDSRVSVGINNVSISPFKVYPNPFTETLTISNDAIIQSIEVFNQTGQLIEKRDGINNKVATFDTRKWVAGVYYVKIGLMGGEAYKISVSKE